jgi:predicted HD superfamily hydrolase involved in NAD metabolism
MQVMEKLAEVYDLEPGKALTAGLLHDAAKDLSVIRQKEVLKQADIEIHYECDNDFDSCLHGPVGAYLVNKELDINDPEILDAIAFHTYYGRGVNFNSPLSWCLRFSDILEPNRDWSRVKWLCSNVDRLADVVYSGHMAEGAFLQTGWLIKWFTEDGMPVHPNMERVYQEFSSRLGLDEKHL